MRPQGPPQAQRGGRGSDPLLGEVRAVRESVGRLRSLKEWEAGSLVEAARKVGEFLYRDRGFTTAKIRAVLDAVNRIHVEARTRGFQRDAVRFMEIRLAYVAGREGTNKTLKELYQLMSAAIRKVSDEEDFERLREFVKGVVAFHRYFGGKDSA